MSVPRKLTDSERDLMQRGWGDGSVAVKAEARLAYVEQRLAEAEGLIRAHRIDLEHEHSDCDPNQCVFANELLRVRAFLV